MSLFPIHFSEQFRYVPDETDLKLAYNEKS